MLVLLLSCPHFASALDKPWVAKNLRAMLNLDTRIDIVVGDPSPSDFAGLMSVPVTIGGGQYVIYVTNDEKRYFWGNVNDLTVDPDQVRMSRMNMKNVHALGSKTAPVTVVEFSDMECPHCSAGHKGMKDNLYKKYTKDQVRLVYKHYPLSTRHLWAETAANAAECAAEQKEAAFWDMAGYFYDNQAKISTATVKSKALDMAAKLQLNKAQFSQCLNDGKYLWRTQADKKEGEGVGVFSTPTYFVNGRMRKGWNTFEDIRVVIDEKLKDLKK